MKPSGMPVIFLAGILACQGAPAATPANTEALPAIPFGAPQAEVARQFGLPAEAAPTVGGCRYWRPLGLMAGVRLMIDDGRVVRVDVDSGPVRTPEGAGLGSTEGEVGRLYPSLQVQPHKYRSDEGWHYLVARPAPPADSMLRFVFETDGRAVRSYRAGIEPFVEFVEGCG